MGPSAHIAPGYARRPAHLDSAKAEGTRPAHAGKDNDVVKRLNHPADPEPVNDIAAIEVNNDKSALWFRIMLGQVTPNFLPKSFLFPSPETSVVRRACLVSSVIFGRSGFTPYYRNG